MTGSKQISKPTASRRYGATNQPRLTQGLLRNRPMINKFSAIIHPVDRLSESIERSIRK